MSSLHVRKVVVVGAGSAGFMSALMARLTLPDLDVVVVRSPNIPVIGVGESTTVGLPTFLHDMLGLDRKQFFDQVRPSWKLGIRYEWGLPGDYHFNYTFDPAVDVQVRPDGPINAMFCQREMRDISLFHALMDRDKAPCKRGPTGQPMVAQSVGYHIENKAFIGYLERKTREFGVSIVDRDVVAVTRDEQGNVTSLRLDDGSELAGDLFIDCTGFVSYLLKQTMGAKFISYADSLFVDSAVVGSWPRADDVFHPYTTATTMDHGWAWRIEFEDHITRGYVFSSAFCSPDEAMRELKAKNPRIGEMRLIKFTSGRYDRFWINNVVAVGNSSGFVEPLEATALHMVVEQLRLLRQVLLDGQGRIVPEAIAVQNTRFALLWDDIRDFLAVHYKFNRRLDTPFWRHARQDTALHGAQPLVDFYRVFGPSTLCDHLIPAKTIFGLQGYLSLLLGQQAETSWRCEPSAERWRIFEQYRERIAHEAESALGMTEALALIHDPHCQWAARGR